jgi:phage baseplate assembly protein W
MDIHSVSTTLDAIEIGATGFREIAQNVRTILTTVKGEVFLDRNFGLNANLIDTPTLVGIAQYRKNIIEEVERLEPRVKVTSVEFVDGKQAMNGTLNAIVRYKIKPGILL